MLHVRCHFSARLAQCPAEPQVRHAQISVETQGVGGELRVVGKLAVDQIFWQEALGDGVTLPCFNGAGQARDTRIVLTNGHDATPPDLIVPAHTRHIMLLQGAVFHPMIHPYRLSILDTVFNLFGRDSVAMMSQSASDLSQAELTELGFQRIAEDLLYRDSTQRSLPSRCQLKHRLNLQVEPEHEAWVLEEWNLLNLGDTSE